MQTLLPDEIYLLVHNIVKFVIDSREGSLLSLSLFLSIWSSSAGFRAVMRGLNKAYDVVDTRNYIVKDNTFYFVYYRTCFVNRINVNTCCVWWYNWGFVCQIFL